MILRAFFAKLRKGYVEMWAAIGPVSCACLDEIGRKEQDEGADGNERLGLAVHPVCSLSIPHPSALPSLAFPALVSMSLLSRRPRCL